jgi:acetyltransferase-like isoleucine patch superfamily enzyme
MNFNPIKNPQSHGSGSYIVSDFKHYGDNIIIENGVLIFHPEKISLFDKIYIGHNTILKGYYNNDMIIGKGTWIGQNCFFHSAGGISIGEAVGIGPDVKILTSYHVEENSDLPVIQNRIDFKKIVIMDGADIGIGSIILPGVTIGEGAIVGAGSIVTKSIEPYSVYAGNPAKFLRKRKGK